MPPITLKKVKTLPIGPAIDPDTLYLLELRGVEDQAPAFDAYLSTTAGGVLHPIAPEVIADNFVLSLYCGMTDTSGGFSIGASWSPITGYSSNSVPDYFIVTDLVNGTMQFKYAGIYRMSILLNLIGFVDSQQGRTTNLRFFDVTTGQPTGDGIVIGIGRNQTDVVTSASFLLDIQAAQLGDLIRLEIGGGDSVTGFSSEITWDCNSVSTGAGYLELVP